MSDIPSRLEAENLLVWAEKKNPGQWVNHSRTVARAAQTIASCCNMDEERSFVLGLLHDIGRYEGKTSLRHVIAGYDLMQARGWNKVAAVCLTHSFLLPDFLVYSGKNDCSAEETRCIEYLLKQTLYDDEIRLIQLCDGISLPDNVTIMEKRLMEVSLRHDIRPSSKVKWQLFLELKTAFDKKCGLNIYQLFREEISNSLFN